MRVLFDHQAFSMQTHGGVSRCFAELYKHLPKDCEGRISLLESNNAYMAEMGIGKPRGYFYKHFILPFHWPYKGKMFTAYNRLIGRGRDYHTTSLSYNQAETVRLLQKGDFDVFHPTYFGDYFLPYLNGKPFVLTIHDMIPELYPQYFQSDDFQIRMKRNLAPLAGAIIAVSDNTKRDVVRILDIPEEKVHVIYHGCSFPNFSNVDTVFDKPYILYVGDRFGYKNFDLFLKYVTPVLKKHQELYVVCTGRRFSPLERQMMEELGVADKFVHYWVSTDAELCSLYHYAICFVYPSEYEGFGIPILEAYQADCPVLLNHASCFPEIAGDAAIYFQMTRDNSDFAEQFERLYSMSGNEREDLLERQRRLLRYYSWEKSAQQLVNIYKSLL